MRHTPPSIQTSLSLRKFSMLTRMRFCPPDPAVHLRWAARRWHGEPFPSLLCTNPGWIVSLRWLPAYSANQLRSNPPFSLPPSPGPKRRGRVRETRRGQVVLGCWLKNQVSAASAGMFADPRPVLKLWTHRLHRCISVSRSHTDEDNCLPAAALQSWTTTSSATVMCTH